MECGVSAKAILKSGIPATSWHQFQMYFLTTLQLYTNGVGSDLVPRCFFVKLCHPKLSV